MRDVANAAGVSVMTVSRALKKDSVITEKTRARILDIVQKMNYVPDQMAGSLTTKRSQFVAVLVPSIDNLHFAKTVQSLTNELSKIDMQILLGHTGYSPAQEEQIVKDLLRRRPDLIVLSYDGHTQKTIDLLRQAAIPIIEIWETPKNPIEHTIGFSNFDAAKKMTEALIAKGYQRIAFLGETKDDSTRGAARRAGFIDAMEDAGLSSHRLIKYGAPPASMEKGAIAAEKALQEHPDVDCLFCVSDIAAFGAQSYLLRQGIKVPEQIAVVGFGNFDVSRFCSPCISTVAVDPDGIGLETGKLIRQLLIDGNNDMMSQHINVPFQIVFRESSKS